jgi:hypothetical protein
MIYEMRNYHAAPGKLRALIARFANVTDAVFKKCGFRVMGYWTEGVGDNNVLHYMLAWEDDAERQEKWALFRADTDRQKAFAESERDGPLVLWVNNSIWSPTAFSAMQ